MNAITVSDPTVTNPIVLKRLNAQSVDILNALRVHSVSTIELSALSLQYSARIADIRNAGYHVEMFDLNPETGVACYRLVNAEDKEFIVPIRIEPPGYEPIEVRIKVLAPTYKRARNMARFSIRLVPPPLVEDSDQ